MWRKSLLRGVFDMTNAMLLYPVFVQVALTFVLLLATGRARVGALKTREVKLKDIALGQTDPWPTRPAQLARSFQNQLETPILFYAVVILALVTRGVSMPLIWLAWAYVALRLVHAFIHTTANNVNQRFMVFIISIGVLAAMWIMLGLHVVATGG
jgi:hypothetical protein